MLTSFMGKGRKLATTDIPPPVPRLLDAWWEDLEDAIAQALAPPDPPSASDVSSHHLLPILVGPERSPLRGSVDSLVRLGLAAQTTPEHLQTI